ncbi:MAG: hypothetical protein WCH07_11350 [Deltaproteobacteria bacterium]
MSNLITSLAFVKASVDSGYSIWDTLTRLTAKALSETQQTEINSEAFCRMFHSFYGIKIPIHPMNMIIGKLKDQGIVQDGQSGWNINQASLTDISISREQEKKYLELLEDLRRYLQEKYRMIKTEEETERLFVGFVNEYDNDILLSIGNDRILPEIENTNVEKYVVASYVEKLVSEESQLVNTLESVLLANIHLNSIFIVESGRRLSLGRTYVYLDTRLLLRLTGIEGEFRREEYLSLIEILHENKFNLRVFDVHLNEVMGILDDCVKWLENPKNYNPKYASRALRYFVETNSRVSDVLACKVRLDDIQQKYKISIDNHNYDLDGQNQYMIDQSELHERIKDIYGSNRNHFESQNVDEMIWNDVKAIAAIYKRRKNICATSLKNVRAILVSNNRALARANREYNKARSVEQKYGEVVTDTYWGTAIWLNTAYKETNFFRKKLIADSIHFTQMNPKLKERYLRNIEERHAHGEFTETEYYVLREYSRAAQYVKDATFNEDEQYTDALPQEVLEHLKDDVAKPLQEIIAQKSLHIENTEASLSKHEAVRDRQLLRTEKIAKRFSRVIMVLFGIIANIPSFVLLFVDFIPNPFLKLVFRVLSLAVGILLSIEGFSREGIGKKIYYWRKKCLLASWNLDIEGLIVEKRNPTSSST